MTTEGINRTMQTYLWTVKLTIAMSKKIICAQEVYTMNEMSAPGKTMSKNREKVRSSLMKNQHKLFKTEKLEGRR